MFEIADDTAAALVADKAERVEVSAAVLFVTEAFWQKQKAFVEWNRNQSLVPGSVIDEDSDKIVVCCIEVGFFEDISAMAA